MAEKKKDTGSGKNAKKLMKKKASALQRKAKKRWFVVKAPECLNSVEIGDITAYEPNALLGRTLNVTMREIAGSMRDSSSKFKVKISKVQGDTAVTEPVLFYIQDSHVQRIERRAKQRAK